MSACATCQCPCHLTDLGNMEATKHRGAFLRAFHFAQRLKEALVWGTDRMDPIAAVFACTACQYLHCEVFSGRPPTTVTPRHRPSPPPVHDFGEGAED